MKYPALILLAIFGASGPVRAQQIHFEKDSLSQVFARAQQQHRPVFVLLASPPPPADLPPALLKSRRESGLNTAAVATALNNEYLSKELAFGTAESAALARKYTVAQWPTYLYFSPDGSLLYRSTGNSSTSQRYLSDLQAARQAQADPQNLSNFQARFREGNRSASLLRQFIGKRRQLGQVVEPELLDAYVEQLPVSAFSQASEVVFVLENGPVIGSKAHQLVHLNQKVYDSLYQVLPSAQRVAINRKIIGNTLARAIATHDRLLANKAAEFSRASWTKNYQRGQTAYEANMLHFYSATKDTASYLRQAVSYYDRAFLGISADSARKAVAALQVFRQEQAATRQRLAAAARRPVPAPGAAGTTAITTLRPVAVGGAPASFLMELNNGAWGVYQTGTHTTQYLWRAVQWSRRTVDLDPTAYHYDTLAHLLYRLRFFHEAEAMQQQALAIARQEKTTTTGYEKELKKMQLRTL
jgi:hypothetical protein